MQKKAAFTFGFVVEMNPCLLIRRNVSLNKPCFLPVGDINIGFLYANLSCAYGFDFRSLQDKASLKFFHEEVFKTGFAIGCDYFYVFCHELILA